MYPLFFVYNNVYIRFSLLCNLCECCYYHSDDEYQYVY